MVGNVVLDGNGKYFPSGGKYTGESCLGSEKISLRIFWEMEKYCE
jgi:hypothetical protein